MKKTPTAETDPFGSCTYNSASSTTSMFYKIPTKAAARHENGYCYLIIPQKYLHDVLWKHVEMQTESINRILRSNLVDIKPLKIREDTHPGQPYHDMPPHLTLAIDADRENVKNFLDEYDQDPIFIKFKIVLAKLIPPTCNGSLSLVVTIQFDDDTKKMVDGFVESLDGRRDYSWHITVGQSFYPPEIAKSIFELEKDHNINIFRAPMNDVVDSKVGGVQDAFNLFEKQAKYTKEVLFPKLHKLGYDFGQYKGVNDHIILTDKIRKRRLSCFRFW